MGLYCDLFYWGRALYFGRNFNFMSVECTPYFKCTSGFKAFYFPFSGIFLIGGEGAKSIVMEISFVILTFLLFSHKICGVNLCLLGYFGLNATIFKLITDKRCPPLLGIPVIWNHRVCRLPPESMKYIKQQLFLYWEEDFLLI